MKPAAVRWLQFAEVDLKAARKLLEEVSLSSVVCFHAQQCVEKGLTRIFDAPEGFIGKALKGAAVVSLLQVLDNAADGHLRKRPKGEIFSAFFQKYQYVQSVLLLTCINISSSI